MVLKVDSGFIGKEKGIKSAYRSLCDLTPVLPEFTEGHRINKALAEMQSELKKYGNLIERYLNLLLYDMNFKELSKMLSSAGVSENKDAYLDVLMQTFPPEKVRAWLLKKSKPVTQRTHGIWDKATNILVAELIRIGFSKNTSNAKTAELLNIFFPGIYKDKSPELVASRVRYNKSHKSSKRYLL